MIEIMRNGPSFGRWLRRKSVGLVRVRTRNSLIDLGLLLSDARGELRVGTCIRTGNGRQDDPVFGRPQVWVVYKIPAREILECTRLG